MINQNRNENVFLNHLSLIAFFLLCYTFSFSQNTTVRNPDSTSCTWTADNGNGTFTNPLFYEEFSNPDLIRVGDDYYMTGTTMHTICPAIGRHRRICNGQRPGRTGRGENRSLRPGRCLDLSVAGHAGRRYYVDVFVQSSLSVCRSQRR